MILKGILKNCNNRCAQLDNCFEREKKMSGLVKEAENFYVEHQNGSWYQL